MLTDELAKKIIAEATQLIQEDLIMVGTDGVIIASTDGERIGVYHEGAVQCIMERKKRFITKKDTKTLKGVKPGLNLPIEAFGQVVGVIGITGDTNQTEPYGELLKRMTELMIQEAHYMDQEQFRMRSLEGFVHEWLDIHEVDGSFRKQAHAWGVDLTKLYQVLLIFVPSDSLYWRAISKWNERERSLAIPYGNNQVLVIHCFRSRQAMDQIVHSLCTLMRAQSWYAGVGKRVVANGLNESLVEAKLALKVAETSGGIIYEEDLQLELLTEKASVNEKQQFVERVLGEARFERELLDTLAAYIQYNQSLKETSEVLHVHINTVHYRFKKLERLTGLQIKSSRGFVTLYLALHFWRILQKKDDFA